MCVLHLTHYHRGLSLQLEASNAGGIDPEEVSGAQEVSETGSVAVSSFLTQRSEISTALSFYILRSSPSHLVPMLLDC